jgi:hypothetical protein
MYANDLIFLHKFSAISAGCCPNQHFSSVHYSTVVYPGEVYIGFQPVLVQVHTSMYVCMYSISLHIIQCIHVHVHVCMYVYLECSADVSIGILKSNVNE